MVLQITVLVYDFAGLDEATIQDTRVKLERILQPAGVSLRWVDCPVPRCSRPERNDIFLRFVRKGREQGRSLYQASAGVTEAGYAGRGLITMLVGNVEEMRLGTHWQFPELLAHAMAHEFCHLVGGLGHSSAGLMAPSWSRSLLQRATPAALALSRSEIESFRDAVRLRTRH